MKNVIFNTIPLLSPLSGVGRYTFEVTSRITGADFNAELRYYYGYFSRSLFKAPEHPTQRKGTFINNTIFRRAARKCMNALASLHPMTFDLYWEPNNIVERSIKSKSVLYTLHDLSVLKHPEWHPERRVDLFTKNTSYSINRSDIIITDSQFIRSEIIDTFNLPSDKVRTINLGYDNDLFHPNENHKQTKSLKSKFTGGRDFIIFSGSLEPRKNLASLIRAYISLPDDIKDTYRLLLVGGTGWNNDEIIELIKSNSSHVIHGGFVRYDELASLYRCASAHVYPSHYEGFGLPPLEAMACGCPVIVSPRASLPEVCGDAAYYVEPDSIENIREGLIQVLTDSTLANAMRKKGFEQCRKFDWDKTAAEHVRCMKELL